MMAHTQLFQSSVEKNLLAILSSVLAIMALQEGPCLSTLHSPISGATVSEQNSPGTASSLSGHALSGQIQTQPHHGAHHSADVDRASSKSTICGWVNLEVQALV